MPVSKKTKHKPKRVKQFSFIVDYTDDKGEWWHRVARAYFARSIDEAVSAIRVSNNQRDYAVQTVFWLKSCNLTFAELLALGDDLPDPDEVDAQLVYISPEAIEEVKRDQERYKNMFYGGRH